MLYRDYLKRRIIAQTPRFLEQGISCSTHVSSPFEMDFVTVARDGPREQKESVAPLSEERIRESYPLLLDSVILGL